MLRNRLLRAGATLVGSFGLVVIGMMMITNACRPPAGSADADIMRLATSMIETANKDMERLLERCSEGRAVHVAASCPAGGR